MSHGTTEEAAMDAAQAAAEWWAQQVGAPVYKMIDDQETGAERLRGDMAGVMAGMIADSNPIGEGQGETFALALAAAIRGELDRQRKRGRIYLSLGVDYGPEQMLTDAAGKAEISTSRFPWKTMMWVDDDKVTASLGYRAPTRLVWASEQWLANRPECGSQHWHEHRDGRDYHGEPFVCSLPKYHDDDCRYDKAISLCATCGAAENWPRHRASEWSNQPAEHEFSPLPAGTAYAGSSR